jgi:hypothetical protein
MPAESKFLKAPPVCSHKSEPTQRAGRVARSRAPAPPAVHFAKKPSASLEITPSTGRRNPSLLYLSTRPRSIPALPSLSLPARPPPHVVATPTPLRSTPPPGPPSSLLASVPLPSLLPAQRPFPTPDGPPPPTHVQPRGGAAPPARG